MAPQQDLARTLLNSLSDEQKEDAFRPDVKSEIRRGLLPEIVQHTGVSAKNLSPEQRVVLFAIIRSYAETLRPSLADAEMKRIELAGLENLSFMWKGNTKTDRGHYYRIQGPAVLIEFHTRDGVHLHSLLRNPQRDFGDDLLQEHLDHHHEIP